MGGQDAVRRDAVVVDARVVLGGSGLEDGERPLDLPAGAFVVEVADVVAEVGDAVVGEGVGAVALGELVRQHEADALP